MTKTARNVTWWTQRRVRRTVVLALVSLVGVGGAARADDTVADGDGALPVSAAINPLNFGAVCVGTSYTDNALIAIKRLSVSTDTLRVFGDGASVTVSQPAAPDDSADLTESFSDSSILLPATWSAVALNTMSTDPSIATANPSASLDVTLVPTGAGVFSKNIFIRAQGPNSLGSTITRSSSFKVNWTASVCDSAAPSVTHTIGTPNAVSGGSTYVTSATTLSFAVDESSNGNSGLSACTVTVDGPLASDGGFTCAEGSNAYTLSTSAPASLASAPDGSYLSSASATDNYANTGTDSFTVVLDNTPPAFGACVGGPYLLGSGGGTQSVSRSASDSGVGLDTGVSTLTGTISTATVGPKSVTYTATDLLGNTASSSCTYDVRYDFSGFFQPVDNLPTTNMAKAGQGIPIKFALGGDQGLGILMAGYPKSFVVNCSTYADLDSIESTVTAGGSSLSYDPLVNAPIGQYVYVWKTEKSWAGTCRQLEVKLMDGTSHFARFSFTR